MLPTQNAKVNEKEILKMRCTVKWFDTKKGYGIISTKGGKEDYFVHQSNIVMDGFRYLCEGDIVDFDVIPGEDGRNLAVNVVPVLTMKMIEDSLKEDGLYVRNMKTAANTVSMNTLGIKKGYMVVNENDVIQVGEQGMTFLDLAAYAGFDTEGLSA